MHFGSSVGLPLRQMLLLLREKEEGRSWNKIINLTTLIKMMYLGYLSCKYASNIQNYWTALRHYSTIVSVWVLSLRSKNLTFRQQQSRMAGNDAIYSTAYSGENFKVFQRLNLTHDYIDMKIPNFMFIKNQNSVISLRIPLAWN